MAEATLADLSQGIKKTNDTLAENLSAQKKLNALLIKQNQERFGGDDLEAEREKSKSQAEAKTIRESKSGGGVSDEGGGLLSKLGFGGGLAAAGGAMGLAKLIGARGIRSALLVALADEAGDAVEAYTGSAEAGDAVERGMVAGGIASIFGARFGIIGGLIAASLTEENQKKLEKLKKSLEPTKDKVVEAIESFGLKLPTVEGVMRSIESTVGGAITGLTNLAEGDYEGFKSSLVDIGLTAGTIALMLKPKGTVMLALKALKAPFKGAATALKGLVTSGTAATATAAASRSAAAAAAAPAATALAKPGSVVTSASGNKVYAGADGRPTTTKVGDKQGLKKIMEAAKKNPIPNVPTPPRLGAFMKLLKAGGPISALIGLADVGMILAAPGSIDEKVDALGGALGSALGGLGGFAAGGVLGGMLTGPLAPFGALGGGVLGGILGAFGGDTIGQALAQYLFGKKVTAFGFPFGWVNDAINGNTEATPTSSEVTAMTDINTKQQAAAAGVPTTSTNADGGGTVSRPDRSTPIQSGGMMGEFGGGSTVIAPTITNNTGQSTTVLTPSNPNANNNEDPVRELGAFGHIYAY